MKFVWHNPMLVKNVNQFESTTCQSIKMKKLSLCLIILLILALLSGCSKICYYFNDAVSFRLENESGRELYGASVAFGTADTVFGSMTAENADGTAFSDKGSDCPVFPVEEGDLNGTVLEDMAFDFSIRTQRSGDFIAVGKVLVKSSTLHRIYSITVIEKDGRLILSSSDPELIVLSGAEEQRD